MRTTLDIDPTVLSVARSLATLERISLGAAVSNLAMRGITSAAPVNQSGTGFPVLVPRNPNRVITDELVEQYRDDS